MADYIRPTPQNPVTGAVARGLRSLQELAAQYQVDPRIPLLGGTSVDELLSLPGAASLMEDVSYQGPRALIKGGNAATGGIGTFRLDPRIVDVADFATIAVPAAAVPAKVAKVGVVVGKKLGREALRQVDRAVMEGTGPLARAVPEAARPMYAVKPEKGGNWRAGEPERGTDQFRQQPDWLSGEGINEAAGTDLWSQMIKQEGHRDPHGWLIQNRPDIYDKLIGPEGTAINRWLDTKLNKYIKNEMGTPEDPVRALAERGTLHFQPQGIRDVSPMMDTVRQRRQLEGMPIEGLGQSPLAQQWERYSDYAITPRTARQITEEAATGPLGGARERGQMLLEENPWIAKLDPETRVYGTSFRAFEDEALGIPHLIDELKNAMAPDSILPANLRLTPDKLNKVTVPQAVELVDKINKWRSAEAAKAEKLGFMQNLQAAPRAVDESFQLSFVDKPGARWVDIPETVTDEGKKFCTTIGKQGGWCTQQEWAATSYGSGENRLVAMLDADGRPHVQAKITKQGDQLAAIDDATLYMTPEQNAAWDRHFGQFDRPPAYWAEKVKWLRENAPEAYRAYGEVLASQSKSPPDITELKPVANSFRSDRAQEYGQRDPEYFRQIENSVLKFLNEGQWGRVADLDHYGIVDLKDPNSLFPEFTRIYNRSARNVAPVFNQAVDAAPNAPRFMTRRQLQDFIGPIDDVPGYAAGGLVGLHNKYAGGGAVKTGLVKVFNSLKTMLSGETPAAARETAEVAEPVREQKMLQGFYRGYAGDYDANKAAQEAGMVFVTPQRAVGELYANKRARQMSADPHLEMILADPFAGYGYGHSTLGTGKNPPMTTKARQLSPEDVKERTPLYAEGGAVEFDPDKVDRMAAEILSQQPVEVGDKPVIFKSPDEMLARQERLQAGPLSLGVVKSPRVVDARLGLDVAPGLEPFADVDLIRRELAQYGVQYNQPLSGGNINAQFAVDPRSGAKSLRGAYRQQIGKDSELSAQGAYVAGAGKPNYNVGVQYRKRFATGGAVEFDSDKIEAMAAQLSEELYA